MASPRFMYRVRRYRVTILLLLVVLSSLYYRSTESTIRSFAFPLGTADYDPSKPNQAETKPAGDDNGEKSVAAAIGGSNHLDTPPYASDEDVLVSDAVQESIKDGSAQPVVNGEKVGLGAPGSVQMAVPANDDKTKEETEPSALDGYQIIISGGGQSRTSSSGPLLDSVKKVPRTPEKFPVKDSIIPLPAAIPGSLGRVQAASFPETEDEKLIRLERRQKVKGAFLVSWNQYKKYGWGYDELRPVSLQPINPFLGKASVIIDALDTLRIMGLDQQYQEALEYVKALDFSTTFRDDVPVFETVIRYLGGLVSAYDLSGRKDQVLLLKAQELADNLMGAFDTPNRMPITYFKWQDKDAKIKSRAGTDVIFAEIASLSVEFTHLAQLSGNSTYYDAIARITNNIYDYAPKSPLPWLYPQSVDASGCEVHFDRNARYMSLEDIENLKEEKSYVDQMAIAPSAQPSRVGNLQRRAEGEAHKLPYSASRGGHRVDEEVLQAAAISEEDAEIEKQFPIPILKDMGRGSYKPGRCKEVAPIRREAKTALTFTFGGLVDSAYEYFPKQFQLLSGGEPKYRELYVNMVEQAKKEVLYKPRVPNNDGVLFVGNQLVLPGGTKRMVYEMAHLTCFAGGMFALGGRLMNRPEDVDIGARVTQGCVWAYNSTRTGVMPETFVVDGCPGGPESWDDEECQYVSETEESPNVDPLAQGRKSQKLSPDSNGKMRWQNGAAFDQPLSFKSMRPMYMLRPEALESVFYMYRITGDRKWQDDGYKMIDSVLNLTAVKNSTTGELMGYSGVVDVTNDEKLGGGFLDTAESFWMGETLKYTYLLFDDPSNISLDEYVFNTEAHPFKLS